MDRIPLAWEIEAALTGAIVEQAEDGSFCLREVCPARSRLLEQLAKVKASPRDWKTGTPVATQACFGYVWTDVYRDQTNGILWVIGELTPAGTRLVSPITRSFPAICFTEWLPVAPPRITAWQAAADHWWQRAGWRVRRVGGRTLYDTAVVGTRQGVRLSRLTPFLHQVNRYVSPNDWVELVWEGKGNEEL